MVSLHRLMASGSWVDDALAVVVILIGLYIVSWFTTHLVGRCLIEPAEPLLNRVPLVQTIYGAVKMLIGASQKKNQTCRARRSC